MQVWIVFSVVWDTRSGESSRHVHSVRGSEVAAKTEAKDLNSPSVRGAFASQYEVDGPYTVED